MRFYAGPPNNKLGVMALPPIVGNSNVTLEGVSVLPPGPPHTYLGMARAFLSGALVMAASKPGNPISLAFLSLQAAECALKAYLSRSGNDERLKKHPLRHDLVALWTLAVGEGLVVQAAPPPWFTALAQLHNSPTFYLRYSTGVNGLVTPGVEPMAAELTALVDQVAKQL